jgi:pyruvate dehydrogenase E1 component
MREMLEEQKDVFYYVTMMNENYAQPDLPAGAAVDVIRGCYHFKSYSRLADGDQSTKSLRNVTLLGSGAILTEVIKAAQTLAAQGVDVDVYSVTSWSELARDGQACGVISECLDKKPEGTAPFIAQQLRQRTGPIIAATDYVRAVPESIRAYLPQGRSYVTLGTDGFGRSDTRAALRGFFGVDAASIVRTATVQLG